MHTVDATTMRNIIYSLISAMESYVYFARRREFEYCSTFRAVVVLRVVTAVIFRAVVCTACNVTSLDHD